MRIAFLFLLAGLASVHPSLAQTSGAKRLPNIVWIIGENLCLDLACHGQENVKTPHLDTLAAEGVNYVNVFATGPV